MARTAQFLGRQARARKGAKAALPSLLFFTDPVRTPDPEAVARRLPRGAAVVFRAFGAADAEARGRRLAAVVEEVLHTLRDQLFATVSDGDIAATLRTMAALDSALHPAAPSQSGGG